MLFGRDKDEERIHRFEKREDGLHVHQLQKHRRWFWRRNSSMYYLLFDRGFDNIISAWFYVIRRMFAFFFKGKIWLQMSLSPYIQTYLAHSSSKNSCGCLPMPFERAAPHSWIHPCFDSDILEGQFINSSFRQFTKRFR